MYKYIYISVLKYIFLHIHTYSYIYVFIYVLQYTQEYSCVYCRIGQRPTHVKRDLHI